MTELRSNAISASAPLEGLFASPDFQQHVSGMAAFFDALADRHDAWRNRNLGYYRQLENLFVSMIPPGRSVLEVGCGTGWLLAATRPAVGVGLDVSPAMIERARRQFPDAALSFEACPVEIYEAAGRKFDYIILSDVVCLLYDIKAVFEKLRQFCHARTRIIMNFHSRLWQPAHRLAERLHLKPPSPPLVNWVTRQDIAGLLQLAGLEAVRSFSRILMPKRLPPVSNFANRFLAPFAPFRWFCTTNVTVARMPAAPVGPEHIVSVVCPCRNEAGNIAEIARRVPVMGAGTELIFVEGGSRDDTYDKCLQAQKAHPEMPIVVLKQTGKGKGDAVRLGFAKARGQVLMILDADISVAPEDLRHFYDVLASGKAEMVNGSRLVYLMEKRAMRFLNLCANKFFGWAFSMILEQPVKDTLCGTKVLTRDDYERIVAGRAYFGDFDPFGDFDLLFGAAKLDLKIQDLPVRYRERVYGSTNISRFRHGWLLLQMCALAMVRLKCR